MQSSSCSCSEKKVTPSEKNQLLWHSKQKYQYIYQKTGWNASQWLFSTTCVTTMHVEWFKGVTKNTCFE